MAVDRGRETVSSCISRRPLGAERLILRSPARARRQDTESVQAIVEFALILVPLLLIVGGIIQFGIGLNLVRQQRIANQGARWAVVNYMARLCPHGPGGHCT